MTTKTRQTLSIVFQKGVRHRPGDAFHFVGALDTAVGRQQHAQALEQIQRIDARL